MINDYLIITAFTKRLTKDRLQFCGLLSIWMSDKHWYGDHANSSGGRL